MTILRAKESFMLLQVSWDFLLQELINIWGVEVKAKGSLKEVRQVPILPPSIVAN